jgi:plastocyanin
MCSLFWKSLAVTAACATLVACGDNEDDDDTIVDEPDVPAVDAGPTPPTPVPVEITEVACSSVVPDHEVTIMHLAFSPASITIASGDVVRWTNDDMESHTVTSGNPGGANAGVMFDSGVMTPADTYCLEFQGTEAHEYFCEFHPIDMDNGLVTVQ